MNRPPAPGEQMKAFNWRQYVIRIDKQRAPIRDHAARDKDAARDRLAADVREFLERGGRIVEAQPRETVPGRPKARAVSRGMYA